DVDACAAAAARCESQGEGEFVGGIECKPAAVAGTVGVILVGQEGEGLNDSVGRSGEPVMIEGHSLQRDQMNQGVGRGAPDAEVVGCGFCFEGEQTVVVEER